MKFGLTGNPLGHSFSKQIHGELFKLKGKLYEYELYPTPDLKCCFDDTLSGLDGFNVTIPYKSEVIELLDDVSDKVKLYDSCNTVVCKEGKYYGYNTDIYGFLNSLKRKNIDLKDKRVLILGAGGVSRMMAFESVINGAEVYIISRSLDKCDKIKCEIKEKLDSDIFVIESDSIPDNIDILLNGTPCGMYPNVLSMPVAYEKIQNVPFVFDTVYNPRKTLLTTMVEYNGGVCENGLYMLAAQAAVAQRFFCDLDYTDEEILSVVDKMDIESMKINKNIILIGPPGSGKTTIGTELAKILGLSFVDVDSQIERNEGRITDIFEKHGESYFRKLESKALADISKGSNQLISTGGGIVVNNGIMDKIANDDNNIVLFINPSFDILRERTMRSNNRPLLVGNTADRLRGLLNERLPLYNKYADYVLEIKMEQQIKSTVIQCIDRLCGF